MKRIGNLLTSILLTGFSVLFVSGAMAQDKPAEKKSVGRKAEVVRPV